MGSIYKRGRLWWIQYYRPGHHRAFRESSRSEKLQDAKRLLAIREGDAARNRNLPTSGKIKFSILLHDLMTDYMLNNRKSIKNLYYQITAHILPYFGDMSVDQINGAVIQDYKAARKDSGVSNDTINGELAAIRRAFRIAKKNGKIETAPEIDMLKRNPPKTDDYTEEQIQALIKAAPEYLVSIMLFANWTGWRRNEILRLKWSEVDFDYNEIRIKPGESKNDQPRVIIMMPELRALMEDRKEATRHSTFPNCPFVFNRDGVQIKSIRSAWEDTRKRAELSDHTFHGFRRTMRRRLDERGISERVGMAIMGHKTRHIYDAYRAVNTRDLDNAMRKLSNGKSVKIDTILDTASPDDSDTK